MDDTYTFSDISGEITYDLTTYLQENEDLFIWYSDVVEELREEYNKSRDLSVGDVVMTIDYNSQATGDRHDDPHRVLIIDISKDKDNNNIYKGFLLSSKVEKSNKNTEKYPNNIYIDDYVSIFDRTRSNDHKPVFIRVDDIVRFSDDDMAPTGVWKGRVSREFMTFVDNAHTNSRTNPKLNANKFFYKKSVS